MEEMMEGVQPLMLKDPEGVDHKIWAKVGGLHLLEPEFTG